MLLTAVVAASGAEIYPGAVLVSRNVNEQENTSPGYWNHLAVYVGEGYVVESQEGYGVLLTPVQDYISRSYSRILCLNPKCNCQGPFRLQRGMNCVTVVEIAWEQQNHWIRRIIIPDDIFDICRSFNPPVVVK
jgi:hypothetical protein